MFTFFDVACLGYSSVAFKTLKLYMCMFAFAKLIDVKYTDAFKESQMISK